MTVTPVYFRFHICVKFFIIIERIIKIFLSASTVPLMNNTKKRYYHNLFESATYMKTTWRRINSVFRPNQVNLKLELKVNDKLVTDSSGIAFTNNNNFSTVAQILKQIIQTCLTSR